jgi:hypothetical protein
VRVACVLLQSERVGEARRGHLEVPVCEGFGPGTGGPQGGCTAYPAPGTFR